MFAFSMFVLLNASTSAVQPSTDALRQTQIVEAYTSMEKIDESAQK